MTAPSPTSRRPGPPAVAGRGPAPPRGRRLATLLVALALTLLVPTLTMAGIAAWHVTAAYRGAEAGRLRDVAGGLAFAVEREIAGDIAALSAFATSSAFGPDPAHPNLPAIYSEARQVAQLLGGTVVVSTADGTQLLSTLRSLGAPLPRLASLDLVARVFATGRPAVGDVTLGSVSGRFAFGVAVPVRDAEGRVALQVSVFPLVARIRDLLQAQTLPDQAMAAVTDAKGITVARSDALSDALVGKPAADEKAFTRHELGLWRGVGRTGIEYFAAFHGIDAAPGWRVVVGEPVAVFADAWRWPLLGLGIGGVAALLLGGGLAALLAKRILLPVRQLAAHARAVAREERGGGAPRATAAQLPRAPIEEVEELRAGFAAAEAALRQSQSHVRSVVEAAADGIVVADGFGRIVSINSAGLRMFGYDTAEDLRGQDLGVLMPRDEAERHGAVVAAHRAGAPPRVIGVPGRELVAVRRDATTFPIDLSVSSFGEHGSFGEQGALFLVGIIRDATARRQAEAALAASEARLRLALEAGQVGTFEWDLRTGALQWNERMHALWGLPAGTPVCIETFYAGLHREDVPRLQAAIAAALDPASGGNYEAEYRVIDQRDGAERHIAARGRVEFAGGQAVRMNGMAIDVTPLRRATEALSREAERLARLAERRGRALAESEARLAEAARMEALGRLAGGIAHDFNNVLQAIQGRLTLAEKKLESDPNDARRHLDRAVDATERGAAVTGRLLSFARRGEPHVEAIAPAALLEGLAEMLRHTLGPDIRLRIEADPAVPSLQADRGQLEAVLVNLANNARDAMPRGGEIVLGAQVPPRHAVPPGLPQGNFVHVCVVDQGEGIPPEVLARVTEPFFTTKPKGKGTGLGLAMARGFAEQSGGTLTIESQLGSGTSVALWLPQAHSATTAADAGPSLPEAPAAPARPPTVLLVEDQADVREMLALELEERGFVVVEAEHADAALALLDAGLRPDAVVTDQSMPGPRDGIGLIEAARQRSPRLPAVLVSGYPDETAADRLAAVERGGPFALVRKPTVAEVLLERLARVLEQGRSGQ